MYSTGMEPGEHSTSWNQYENRNTAGFIRAHVLLCPVLYRELGRNYNKIAVGYMGVAKLL